MLHQSTSIAFKESLISPMQNNKTGEKITGDNEELLP